MPDMGEYCEMPDIGKVIKAVECRANGNGQQGCIGWDVDCPYSFGHAFCDMNQLLLDILAMLKEQEEIINRYQWEDGEPK